jgi:DNA-binding MarR family transcriptional regulator
MIVSSEINEAPMAKKRETSPLYAHAGFWLRFVSNHVSHAFARKVEARGVTVAEWAVLRALFDGPAMPPSTLADVMGMTRGAITKLADRLIEKSFVTRTQDKDDRRWQALTLTAAGRALVPKLATLADRNDAEFFGHLKARERAALIATMKDIVQRRGLKTIPTE